MRREREREDICIRGGSEEDKDVEREFGDEELRSYIINKTFR